MKALILAGGLGTRLRPLTFTRPKHLLPVANRAHIDGVFDLLAHHGIRQVVLLTSYLARAFDEVAQRAASDGLKVEVTHEPEPLGTAGALKNAEGVVGDDSFLVLNGDILTDLDLGAVVRFHHARGAAATIVLTEVADPSSFGVVPTDDEGRVLGFVEKPEDPPPGALINAGVYVLEPSVLERIPRATVWSAERQLFPSLVEEGAVYGFRGDAYWIDVGTPEKYLEANLDALSGRFGSEVAARAPDGVLLGEGARVGDGARIAQACLGPRAEVAAEASVERTVLLPDAFVSGKATVRDAILGEGARVEPGATVIGKAIADHDVVRPG